MTTLILWQVSQSLYANTATQALKKKNVFVKANLTTSWPHPVDSVLLISSLSRTLCARGPII